MENCNEVFDCIFLPHSFFFTFTFTAAGCGNNVDLVFLLDTSGSVGQGNFNKMLMFVDQVVRLVGFELEMTRVGIITFSSDARIAFQLEDYKTQRTLTKAIMAVTYMPGQTNMAAALRKMREDMFAQMNGDRPGVANIAVLIADGFSSVDPLDTLPQAELARDRGVVLHTVGISIPDEDEIRAIAGSEERVFIVPGFKELLNIAEELKEAICAG